MNELWWNQNFLETLERFRRIFKIIIVISLILRTLLSFFYSFQLIFGSPQRELTIIIAGSVWLLGKLNDFGFLQKKLILCTAIEALNIGLFYASKVMKSEKIIFCIESTLITILFQSNIFSSISVNFVLIFKHLMIWYIIDPESAYSISTPLPFAILSVIISIWLMFESDKRNKLLATFQAKASQKAALSQCVEILKIFPEGLIIFNKDFCVKYINDAASDILKSNDANPLDSLKSISILTESITVYDKLRQVDCTNFEQLHMGVSYANENYLEWNLHAVIWDSEPGCILIIKNVTKALVFERISQENKSKTALFRSVSHELRTPVNALSMILDEIVEKCSDYIKIKISYMKTCIDLLNFQISDILDYSELSSENFQINVTDCNLKEALKKCADLVEVQTLYKHINFKSKIDDLIPDVIAVDSYRIQKVVMNLLNNAVKFTISGTIELCAINTGNHIEISVKDSGIGIPKERLEEIFKLFSDKSSSCLSGLGLHISMKILKEFNSKLSVSSIVGEGSIFSFELKLNSQNPQLEMSGEIDVPAERVDYHTVRKVDTKIIECEYAKVLIVDDNDFNRICLGSIFKNKGIKYLEACNGEEAIRLIMDKDITNNPLKCIFMDCNMPVVDGWEAAKCINNRYTQGIIKHLPSIIAYTAYSSKEDIQRCYESGMISYILKPASNDEILATISKYV